MDGSYKESSNQNTISAPYVCACYAILKSKVHSTSAYVQSAQGLEDYLQTNVIMEGS